MSEERELLRDTVAALVEKHASPEAVRQAMESERGYDETLWKLLCEQVGAAALVVPEELGGAGGELADAAVVHRGARQGPWCRRRCSARRWPSSRCWPPTNPTPTRSRELAEGTSIGAVVFDPGFVVNGDVADVVVAADGRDADPLDRVHREPVAAMDPTRRLARLERRTPRRHRRRSRPGRHRGDPGGRRADRRRSRGAST